ncbi:trypsin-like cysteine/serine peptidase domain-containing protein [Phlyctochytrium arcticum]|nr:trypsin-like cysteine/serine peptidase domain-containing protein [Phlyctochytrium arcticum]
MDTVTDIQDELTGEAGFAGRPGDDDESTAGPAPDQLSDLYNSRHNANSSQWEETLKHVIPAIVSIRFISVRNFDTEHQRASQASGFIVDKTRGIVLTNRHVVQPGPILAEAILNESKEEIQLIPIYRDPVHDFGFFQFDVSKVKYMKIVEIPLAPEQARVGIDVRVVGNDSGERLSILSGTLARLDRKAPFYGTGRFNDWNTFYYQAASMTSGGSSGSPVINAEGNAIALNAGGATLSASSFFLPLDRVVRVLRLLQSGEPITRGTIQTIFKFTPYDEVKRLGLDASTEREIREKFPEGTGMLTVSQVVPKGPADSRLEAGDILLELNGNPVISFVPVEAVLDDSVGKTITLTVQRGAERKEIKVDVQDLHSITPSRYVEVGGGVLNDLSYQVARSFMVPVGGVYVAGPGYMLHLAGINRRCVITSLNNQGTPTLDKFVEIMSGLKDNERVPIRYFHLSDINKQKLALVQIDRRWHPLNMATRNDQTGLWDYVNLPPCNDVAEYSPHTASHIRLDEGLGPGRKVVPALVHVEFHLPFRIDGVIHQVHSGIGLVVDVAKGLIIVDRHTVPTSVGDILLTFANSIIIPGKLVYLHQIYNFGVVQYDTSLLGETFVQEAVISDKTLNQGDSVYLVALTKSYQPVVRKTVVTNVRQFFVNEPIPPAYRAANVEGIELENPVSQGGVLTDAEGRVQALYAAHTKHAAKGRNDFHLGLPIELALPIIDRLKRGESPVIRGLEVELTYAQIAHARILGLSDDWVRRIEGSHLSRRNVLVVRRLTSGTAAASVLKEGDLILAVNDEPATRFLDILGNVDAESLNLTILREGREEKVNVPLSLLESHGTDRIVGWSGAIFQMPHKAVYQQLKEVPAGVMCSVVYDGSPSQLYNLHPLTWVTEVNSRVVTSLDTFLAAVSEIPSGDFARLRIVTFNRFVKVITIRINRHYFGTWEIRRQTDSALEQSDAMQGVSVPEADGRPVPQQQQHQQRKQSEWIFTNFQ